MPLEPSFPLVAAHAVFFYNTFLLGHATERLLELGDAREHRVDEGRAWSG